jgi:hypothetical protein
MTKLQNKRREKCREIMELLCQYEERKWDVLDTLALDKIDGHDSADQFLMLYARKMDEVLELMNEYYECFRKEEENK